MLSGGGPHTEHFQRHREDLLLRVGAEVSVQPPVITSGRARWSARPGDRALSLTDVSPRESVPAKRRVSTLRKDRFSKVGTIRGHGTAARSPASTGGTAVY